MSPIEFTLRVTNDSDQPRLIELEPWTGEYTLQAGKNYDIVTLGDASYPLRMFIRNDRLVLECFGSAGGLMTVYQDGVEQLTDGFIRESP